MTSMLGVDCQLVLPKVVSLAKLYLFGSSDKMSADGFGK
jgi:hypothetical protein